ncbi:hypothetical protein HDZ31DRAFT_82682 [Schizophyllum fasciatum]
MLFFQRQPKAQDAVSAANLSGPLVQLGGVTYVNLTYDGPDKYDGPEVRATRPGLPRNRSTHIVVRDPGAIRAHEARMQRAATAAALEEGARGRGAWGRGRAALGGVLPFGGKTGASSKRPEKKVSEKDRFKAMEREMDLLIAARF